MVKDPVTGKPVQQVVQTIVDPKTGKTMQVPAMQTVIDPKTGKAKQVPASTPQVVMMKDPATGKMVQQLVQTVVDPKTGKTMQVPLQQNGGAGAQQIITTTDPKTGLPVQQIVQTVIDPKTGKPTQVTTPLSNFTQNGNFSPSNAPTSLQILNFFRRI